VHFVSETAQVELKKWTSVSPCLEAALQHLHRFPQQVIVRLRRLRLLLQLAAALLELELAVLRAVQCVDALQLPGTTNQSSPAMSQEAGDNQSSPATSQGGQGQPIITRHVTGSRGTTDQSSPATSQEAIHLKKRGFQTRRTTWRGEPKAWQIWTPRHSMQFISRNVGSS